MVLKSKMLHELQRKIFELTLALYRVTDFFPQQEALRKHLREKANEIFGSITEYVYGGSEPKTEPAAILARLQSMREYLELARSLRFVKPINIIVLEREYNVIICFFESELGAHYVKDAQKTQKYSGEECYEVTEQLQTWEDFSQEIVEELPPAVSEHPRLSVSRRTKTAAPLPISGGSAGGINDRQKTIMEHIKAAQQAKISDFFPVFEGISSKTIQRDLQDLVTRDILKKEGEKRWTVYSFSSRENDVR